MSETLTIEYRDPADLRPHKLIADLHRWMQGDENFNKFVENIRENGILLPLQILKDGRVVDGEMRRTAAKALQFEWVPVIIVSEDEAASIVLSSMIQRRHYTPGQRAYQIAPMIDEAWNEAHRRMLAGREKDPRNSVSRVSKTPDEWAAEIGVSVQYLRQARELHELFAAHPEKRDLTDSEGVTVKKTTFRKFFEARIMREEKPYGLGAVKAGITYILDAEKWPNKKTGGRAKDTDKQLRLFNDVVENAVSRWDYFQKWDDATKKEHWKTVRIKAETIPTERAAAMADYYKQMAREFGKAAKKGAA